MDKQALFCIQQLDVRFYQHGLTLDFSGGLLTVDLTRKNES